MGLPTRPPSVTRYSRCEPISLPHTSFRLRVTGPTLGRAILPVGRAHGESLLLYTRRPAATGLRTVSVPDLDHDELTQYMCDGHSLSRVSEGSADPHVRRDQSWSSRTHQTSQGSTSGTFTREPRCPPQPAPWPLAGTRQVCRGLAFRRAMASCA